MAFPATQPDLILAEQYFASEDDRFVAQIRKPPEPRRDLAPFAKGLIAFVDRWRNDARPWARAQIIAYLREPLNAPFHQPVVKRLFKSAEDRRDDEVLAAFLVAFDRQIKQRIATVYRKQPGGGYARVTEVQRELVKQPPFEYHPKSSPEKTYYWWRGYDVLFGLRTRYYLQRRVWRYFRRLGWQRPTQYCAAVAAALVAYRDADLRQGLQVLSARNLLQITFGEHPGLEFKTHRVVLKAGTKLADLTPAPRFATLWKEPAALHTLLTIAIQGQARFVRAWAMALLRSTHRERLLALPLETWRPLLSHDDADVQAFAVEYFTLAVAQQPLAVSAWLRLITEASLTVVGSLVKAFLAHVDRAQVTLADRVRLAVSPASPVAGLGLELLEELRPEEIVDRAALVELADARCEIHGEAIAAWALRQLDGPSRYDVDQASRFFDSLSASVRRGAWAWVNTGSSGFHDPILWVRLLETPYPDLRLDVAASLERREALVAANPAEVRSVWISVLAGVERGGRQKLRLLKQLASLVQKYPEEVDTWLPVLAFAARSIRGPESRQALVEIVRLAEQRPDWSAKIVALLPELEISATEAAR